MERLSEYSFVFLIFFWNFLLKQGSRGMAEVEKLRRLEGKCEVILFLSPQFLKFSVSGLKREKMREPAKL